MSTLHTLRRHYDLSLGELAQLTGIPLRRLAEYEYEDRPLPPEDQHALVTLFSKEMHSMGSGWESAATIDGQRRGQPEQAYLLAAFAATVALSGTLGLGNTLRQVTAQVIDAIPAVLTRPEPIPPTPEPTMLPVAIVLPVVPTPRPTATALPTATPQPTRPPEPANPHLCPVGTTHGAVVVMASYTAGTHEPTNTNGAVDLAVDANGDGRPESWASRNAAVYATHAGMASVRLDSWPAGNYVGLDGAEGWRTGYSHLENVLVKEGDRIEAGQQIGTVGSTGRVGGPSLDYKIWHNEQNTDPTPMLNCD